MTQVMWKIMCLSTKVYVGILATDTIYSIEVNLGSSHQGIQLFRTHCRDFLIEEIGQANPGQIWGLSKPRSAVWSITKYGLQYEDSVTESSTQIKKCHIWKDLLSCRKLTKNGESMLLVPTSVKKRPQKSIGGLCLKRKMLLRS